MLGSMPAMYGAQVQVSWMPASRARSITSFWNSWSSADRPPPLSSSTHTRATWVAVGARMRTLVNSMTCSRVFLRASGLTAPATLSCAVMPEVCTLSTLTSRCAPIKRPHSTSQVKYFATTSPASPFNRPCCSSVSIMISSSRISSPRSVPRCSGGSGWPC
ncbi:Uncharacterised protein [Bordetella pertussis]|nr:Uncharacterised protein [Bordetella pertussis]